MEDKRYPAVRYHPDGRTMRCTSAEQDRGLESQGFLSHFTVAEGEVTGGVEDMERRLTGLEARLGDIEQQLNQPKEVTPEPESLAASIINKIKKHRE